MALFLKAVFLLLVTCPPVFSKRLNKETLSRAVIVEVSQPTPVGGQIQPTNGDAELPQPAGEAKKKKKKNIVCGFLSALKGAKECLEKHHNNRKKKKGQKAAAREAWRRAAAEATPTDRASKNPAKGPEAPQPAVMARETRTHNQNPEQYDSISQKTKPEAPSVAEEPQEEPKAPPPSRASPISPEAEPKALAALTPAEELAALVRSTSSRHQYDSDSSDDSELDDPGSHNSADPKYSELTDSDSDSSDDREYSVLPYSGPDDSDSDSDSSDDRQYSELINSISDNSDDAEIPELIDSDSDNSDDRDYSELIGSDSDNSDDGEMPELIDADSDDSDSSNEETAHASSLPPARTHFSLEPEAPSAVEAESKALVREVLAAVVRQTSTHHQKPDHHDSIIGKAEPEAPSVAEESQKEPEELPSLPEAEIKALAAALVREIMDDAIKDVLSTGNDNPDHYDSINKETELQYRPSINDALSTRNDNPDHYDSINEETEQYRPSINDALSTRNDNPDHYDSINEETEQASSAEEEPRKEPKTPPAPPASPETVSDVQAALAKWAEASAAKEMGRSISSIIISKVGREPAKVSPEQDAVEESTKDVKGKKGVLFPLLFKSRD